MLQLAVSSDDAGLVNVLDAQSFARLLPLLGEQLNEAKVEQLFGAIDADDSGTIEFDEFVKVIQMLHPLQATRRSAAVSRDSCAGVAALAALRRTDGQSVAPV